MLQVPIMQFSVKTLSIMANDARITSSFLSSVVYTLLCLQTSDCQHFEVYYENTPSNLWH